MDRQEALNLTNRRFNQSYRDREVAGKAVTKAVQAGQIGQALEATDLFAGANRDNVIAEVQRDLLQGGRLRDAMPVVAFLAAYPVITEFYRGVTLIRALKSKVMFASAFLSPNR